MPTVTNQNIPLVHRKEWQMMTPAPTASGAGMFIVTDAVEKDNLALYVCSSTVHWLYYHDEDSYVQIPSGALAGTFGAGSCGTRGRWSNTLTATAGTTTSLTTTTLISSLCIGNTIRFLTGLNAGRDAVCTGVVMNAGTNYTLQFAALPSAVANTDTFVIDTGKFYILNAGTLASGSFKSFDPLSGIWTTLVITNLPASIGTDGKLVSTPSNDSYATGTATSGTTSVLTNTPKTWTVNQWTNYQVRIVSGTGIGQVRTIASNTANTLTTTAVFSIAPDATSTYEITGNDDFLYFLGNNAVTMYRYSISLNTWTVMAPTVARTGAPGVGMSSNWVGLTDDPNFANESDIRNGRYIYSFRGGGTSLVDRFDIAGGTAGAGAWLAITYPGQIETFTTGSAYAISGRYIYVRKDATHRYFKFSMRGNYLEPLTTNLYPDGAAVIGDKSWVKNYTENGVTKLSWLYSLRNSGTELHRLLLY